MRDYQENVTTGQTDTWTDRHMDRQTDGQTDTGQSDPYVPLCFAGDTKITSIMLILIENHKVLCKLPPIPTV